MASAAYTAWVKAGKPWKLMQPVADLSATLRRYGFTVGTIGNDAHLMASTPEDHTPFSKTGWPGAHPYPYVGAIDIMPPRAGSGLPDLGHLGAQIVADRNAGVAGALCIKYVNWTPNGGSCRHERWQPTHVVTSSSDVGHIHISMRSDVATSAAMAGYDPVARVRTGATGEAKVSASIAPAWPGRYLKYTAGQALMSGADVRTWQAQMETRGWTITADGDYGPASAKVCGQFQADKGLGVDSIVGPITWRQSWESAVT